MDLLFDIGNTRLKWVCVQSASQLSGELPVAKYVYKERNIDALLTGELEDVPGIKRIFICSVANPAVTQAVQDWCQCEKKIMPVLVASCASFQGVKNSYREPTMLGSDRFAMLVAAAARNPGGFSCIVSAGTAMTIDLLDQSGQHLGGYIAPGLEQQLQSLQENTNLDVASFNNEEQVTQMAQFAPGTSTQQAIMYGCMFMQQSMVNSIYQAWQEKPGFKMYITGGNGELLANTLGMPGAFTDSLLMQGIWLLGNSLGNSLSS